MSVARVAIPPPGPHGGDAEAVARALGIDVASILDLSLTLNPLAADISPLVCSVASAARRYPDPAAATAALAGALGVEPSRVLLTNGAAEAIALVATELVRLRTVDPEFSLWRRHLQPAETTEPGVGRARSNPNNPTGRLAAAEERAAVWDEAFYQLATGTWTRGDADRGAVVVGSLTKLFACPGLRLGYVLAPEAGFVERLAARQARWSVNSLAVAALPGLLAAAPLERWAAELRALREELVALLRGWGLRVIAESAPWVLVSRAGSLRDELARRGVLVRDCASFGLADTVRVAVPARAELGRLEAALHGALADRG